MTVATPTTTPARSLDLRVHAAVETIRALRASGIEDPFAALRADLHARLAGQEDQREASELLRLAEVLTTLAAEAEALAILQQ